ncbi:hypothetical protein CLOSTASPAR_05563 [[Clostridium] asparagiforme DSM 15981]|uniref:Uncharacterized protein n=1 Tax=[Clostridium] asparagiforme DSM 15981 TaxID=518636 RepID=C0D8G4_9FIRM|nr:hypothetical protein CLOSTASPAR_05563 [[Clostridium] asparagiforme DSM 15981]
MQSGFIKYSSLAGRFSHQSDNVQKSLKINDIEHITTGSWKNQEGFQTLPRITIIS